MTIRPFRIDDIEQVIRLWERCRLTRPWNDPRRDIERKLEVDPELFLVGVRDGAVVATAMAGYEGHRGWVNYLAVEPSLHQTGLGRRLMQAVEEQLKARGCPKINIQIRADNIGAQDFYRKLGYDTDEVVTMGKRLDAGEPRVADRR